MEWDKKNRNIYDRLQAFVLLKRSLFRRWAIRKITFISFAHIWYFENLKYLHNKTDWTYFISCAFSFKNPPPCFSPHKFKPFIIVRFKACAKQCIRIPRKCISVVARRILQPSSVVVATILPDILNLLIIRSMCSCLFLAQWRPTNFLKLRTLLLDVKSLSMKCIVMHRKCLLFLLFQRSAVTDTLLTLDSPAFKSSFFFLYKLARCLCTVPVDGPL